MLVGLCLAIMLILTLFSITLGQAFVGGQLSNVVDGSQIVNGSTSSYELSETLSVFSIDSVQGVIFWIVVIMTLAGLVGIQILASGLGENAQRILSLGTAYIGLWISLSALAFPLFMTIEYFGSLLFITLTVLYAIGVFQKVFTREGGD